MSSGTMREHACVEKPEAISPRSWPDLDWYEEIGLSPGLRLGNLLFVSGCSGADVYPNDPQAQIRQAYRYLGEVLEAAGSSWDFVVSLTTYHVDLHAHIADVLKVHREFVTKRPYPAWTGIGVSELLQPGAIFEVAVIAEVPGRH
jgi:enamine deaminase RidA (YjgF/YER057c/UK114 family)